MPRAAAQSDWIFRPGHQRHFFQGFKRKAVASGVDQPSRRKRRRGDGTTRSDGRKLVAQPGQIIRGNRVGAGDQDNTSPTEGRDRFPEQTPRKQVPKAERVGGVNEDDIEIAGESAVLETVIKHERFRPPFLDRVRGTGDAIYLLMMGYVGAKMRENPQFIVFRRSGIGVRLPLGIFRGIEGAVAPAEQRHADAPTLKITGDIRNNRRFSGAARRDVANTDDGHTSGVNVDSLIEPTVPAVDGPAVADFANAESCAEAGGDRPGPAAGHLVVNTVVHAIFSGKIEGVRGGAAGRL